MNLLAPLEDRLAAMTAAQLIRRRRIVETPCDARMRIAGDSLLCFASNDYLGLAAHPLLIEALAQGAARYGVGSGGSHVVGGHSRAHADAETDLAAYVGGFSDAPRALYFSTGYMANLAVLSALAGREAALFCDAYNHASLIDGARLSRAAVDIYPHLDLQTLEQQLRACGCATKLIVTDGVFSMDGDLAPVAALLELAERYQAWLVVDDAHGFGVIGGGRGILEHAGVRSPHLIYVGTLGKAAGVAGAFVVAHETVIETLLQRGRSYIFTTAAPPAIAYAVSASVRLIASAEGAARRLRLQISIARVREMLNRTAWQPLDSRTAIQPLLIGTNQAALDLTAALENDGLWVPAIRPPTVPVGSARLRISLSAAHTDADLDVLHSALHKASYIRAAT
jgi:8-amino-7-oxononanoate synthase